MNLEISSLFVKNAMKEIEISTDKSRLDINFIAKYLQETYWANKRSFEDIKISIENSLCFGVYSNRSQIGFARVVTDKSAFAYLMDVFIVDQQKGNGLGSLLLDEILQHQDIKNIETFKLATHDAHEFYVRKGFKQIAHPEFQMEKLNKNDE